jgi:FdhD protein
MSDLPAVLSKKVQEVQVGSRENVEVSFPAEIPLTVELNGRSVATLMVLPGMEKAVAVGFCLSEGLITSFHDVLLVHYCRDEESDLPLHVQGRVVRLQARPEAVRDRGDGVRLVLSGCGSAAMDLKSLDLPQIPLEGPVVSPEALWQIARTLRRSQGTYRQSGAVHAAGLFDPHGETLILAEDIGRHNAVDKVLGAALIQGIPLEDKILLGTGRASHDIVSKGLRLRVPLVVSFSAPTSLAVALAEQGGCTLIGRLRQSRFLIYSHPHRIAAG